MNSGNHKSNKNSSQPLDGEFEMPLPPMLRPHCGIWAEPGASRSCSDWTTSPVISISPLTFPPKMVRSLKSKDRARKRFHCWRR